MLQTSLESTIDLEHWVEDWVTRWRSQPDSLPAPDGLAQVVELWHTNVQSANNLCGLKLRNIARLSQQTGLVEKIDLILDPFALQSLPSSTGDRMIPAKEALEVDIFLISSEEPWPLCDAMREKIGGSIAKVTIEGCGEKWAPSLFLQLLQEKRDRDFFVPKSHVWNGTPFRCSDALFSIAGDLEHALQGLSYRVASIEGVELFQKVLIYLAGQETPPDEELGDIYNFSIAYSMTSLRERCAVRLCRLYKTDPMAVWPFFHSLEGSDISTDLCTPIIKSFITYQPAWHDLSDAELQTRLAGYTVVAFEREDGEADLFSVLFFLENRHELRDSLLAKLKSLLPFRRKDRTDGFQRNLKSLRTRPKIIDEVIGSKNKIIAPPGSSQDELHELLIDFLVTDYTPSLLALLLLTRGKEKGIVECCPAAKKALCRRFNCDEEQLTDKVSARIRGWLKDDTLFSVAEKIELLNRYRRQLVSASEEEIKEQFGQEKKKLYKLYEIAATVDKLGAQGVLALASGVYLRPSCKLGWGLSAGLLKTDVDNERVFTLNASFAHRNGEPLYSWPSFSASRPLEATVFKCLQGVSVRQLEITGNYTTEILHRVSLQAIQSLCLGNVEATDEWKTILSQLRLKKLFLIGKYHKLKGWLDSLPMSVQSLSITLELEDDRLVHLKSLTKISFLCLKKLEISNLYLNDRDFLYLSAMPLRSLTLRNCLGFTGKGLTHLTMACLKELDLSWSMNVDKKVVQAISLIPSSCKVTLTNTSISPEVIKKLKNVSSIQKL